MGFVLSRLLNRKWVTTIHGHYGAWRLRWALKWMFHIWNRADTVVAISEELKRWLVRNGVDESKIKVIPYGV